MRFYILLFISLVISYAVLGQSQGAVYQYFPDVKVYDLSGNEQTMAWCGGFNNPQFSMGDLNNDGKQDLVAYESGKGIKTFINTGSSGNPVYTYAPQYELNFPPVYDYLILADYNRDNIPDLFEQGSTGYMVFRGYYNAQNQLCFSYYKALYYDNDVFTNGPANAYNNPGDIPAIVDVDNDGDLDFISYDVIGGHLNFYKNLQQENNLSRDSIVIKLVDRCWGKVFQNYYRTHILNYSCDESGLNKPTQTTHQGNTPCLFDYDGDGDYDYLDGSISFSQMTFLLNGRVEYGSVDSMVYQDTLWQSNGTPINLLQWPAAFNIDIDQDGKKDLVIAPNAQNLSENYKCIWFYKNESTPGHPSFVYQSDTFLIDKTIDLGTAAYPALFDYDKDGKPDLFIGSDGYMQTNGIMKSRISYYKNTSTPGHPSFKLQTKDFLGIGSNNFSGIAPAFGDINNDGKTDLILGHSDGTLSFYENTASSDSVQPVWQSLQVLKDGNGYPITVNSHAAPFVYDMNKDGKPDLIIGAMNGYLTYCQNNSLTPGQLNLWVDSTHLGGVKADPASYLAIYSTPYIGRMDNTNKDYILLGSSSGNLYRFDGFQNGDVSNTAHYTMIDSQYSYIDSTYLSYNHLISGGAYNNLRVAPVVGDIDGDGKYEMIVGDIYGGVKMYKQMSDVGVANVTVTEETPIANIYPNPAHDHISISWNKSFSQGNVQIRIVNMQGQQVLEAAPASKQQNATVSVAGLPAGVYICIVQAGNNKYYGRFTILK